MNWPIVWEHLYIVLMSVLFSLAAGLPLGIWAYLSPKARGPILAISDLFQTIPSLALLGVIMVFLGAGKPTVIAGITLYSLLPIVRNTWLGLHVVEPGLKDSARGCGMSRAQQLFKVELPLALPMIFTGIRIAVVNAIGTAVFAAFVGGGGLGTEIYQGIRTKNMSEILIPTAVLMVIAVLFDGGMGWLEKYLKKVQNGKPRRRWVPISAAAVICTALIGGSIAYGAKNTASTLRIYDGNFSEMQIITHMVKYLVEDNTDLKVNIMGEMTGVNAFNELTASNPSCDLMMGYDGTLLTTYLHGDPADVPEGESLYDYANAKAMDKYGIRLLKKFGLNNTYAIAVPETIAEQYHLEKVSDLVPSADKLIFGAEHEFFTQEGSMKYGPFTQFYGLHFKDAVSVDIGLKYSAIENGSFQVTEVYATDGLNRKAKLKILEDDRKFFPEYNGALLVRNDIFERYKNEAPELEDVLNELGGKFTNETMTDLTYAVDVENRDPDDVAREFLLSQGLIGKSGS